MSEPGFDVDEGRRQFLKDAGLAALSAVGAQLISARAADAEVAKGYKGKKRGTLRARPRLEAPGEASIEEAELNKATRWYVDTVEGYLKEAGKFPLERGLPPQLARKIAQLTQQHVRATAILAEREDQARPELDAHHLHYGVVDAFTRKHHDPRIANYINHLWYDVSVRAVWISRHPDEPDKEDPGIHPPGDAEA